ncbi:hypothetical protein RB601_009255 [Gaeumannomyces tritici]
MHFPLTKQEPMSQMQDPRTAPIQHKTGLNRGIPAGPYQYAVFSPPASSHPGYADAASTSSEYEHDTPASSDWHDGSSVDLVSDPGPCREPNDSTNESPRGSDGADATGGDSGVSHPGGDATAAQPAGDGTTPRGRPSELEYQEQFGPQIEAWLSDLERRAARNTNVFLNDGVTPNPVWAPYISLQVGGKSSQGNWCSNGSEPFWKWSILLQRWIHEDIASGMLLIYPKQLTH